MSKKVKLYNKGKRRISYAKDRVLPPQGHIELSAKDAEKLVRLYPLELVDFSKMASSNSEDKELKAELKEAKGEIRRLKKALDDALSEQELMGVE